MEDQSGNDKNATVCVDIPKALYERVDTFCKTITVVPYEFILDAISEKLASVHQERRKKQRL